MRFKCENSHCRTSAEPLGIFSGNFASRVRWPEFIENRMSLSACQRSGRPLTENRDTTLGIPWCQIHWPRPLFVGSRKFLPVWSCFGFRPNRMTRFFSNMINPWLVHSPGWIFLMNNRLWRWNLQFEKDSWIPTNRVGPIRDESEVEKSGRRVLPFFKGLAGKVSPSLSRLLQKGKHGLLTNW